MCDTAYRLPHAALDIDSSKARKIAHHLSGVSEIRDARVLEIGTGAGHIASPFDELVGTEGGALSQHFDVEKIVFFDSRRDRSIRLLKNLLGGRRCTESGSSK